MKIDTTQAIEIYKGMTASGMTDSEAVTALQTDHGMTLKEAAHVCWLAETGEGLPNPDTIGGRRRMGKWYRGHERRLRGW